MTNEQHNSYIAYTFLGHAAFQLLMMLLMVAMFSMVFYIQPEPGQPAPPKEFFGVMIGFMTVFQLIFLTPSIVAAYALLKHKSWARIAAIIGGVMAAMSVPVGTAACVYSLWFFLGDKWRYVYSEKANVFPGHNPQIEYGVESQWAAYQQEKREAESRRRYEPPDWR